MSVNNLGKLRKDFLVMDRKAVKVIVRELERALRWQRRAMKIIERLRKKNAKV